MNISYKGNLTIRTQDVLNNKADVSFPNRRRFVPILNINLTRLICILAYQFGDQLYNPT